LALTYRIEPLAPMIAGASCSARHRIEFF